MSDLESARKALLDRIVVLAPNASAENVAHLADALAAIGTVRVPSPENRRRAVMV